MTKFADYFISKVKQNPQTTFLVHKNDGNNVAVGEKESENWVIQKIRSGYTFSTIKRTENPKWSTISDVSITNGYLKYSPSLPLLLTRRKSFISYYHKEDQDYKEKFDNLTDDLIINKSVEDGDISSDVSDEYAKQLIQKGYLEDTTVLIVLIGKNTKKRKHVDWEISGALNLKVGDNYAGLLGLRLPSHPDYGKPDYRPSTIPARLDDNLETGYAIIRDYTTDRKKLQGYIEEAFKNRTEKSDKRTNSRKQMQDDG
jgi:hypothetical protein